ncbi:hypothetical protein B0H19DRAFT_540851 [Mycena capillaripes]|nr:hypothetical protein B0H19DRAFT_540851 [Mycena capillaripes]
MSDPAKARSKPIRARVAPNKLVDGSNSEAPSAVHQAVVEETQARLTAVNAIMGYIQNIDDLSYVLPASIAEGTEDDEIHRVITFVHGHDAGDAASTFNRRFDILFKEDSQCRVDGRLHLIRRGEYGMRMVVQYLRSIKWTAANMNLDGAGVKLVRIVKELEFLSDMSALEAQKAAKAAGKSKQPDNVAKKPKKTAKAAAVPPLDPEDRDPDYNPKKRNASLSEEEEDDDLDDAVTATAAGAKKRKILVVEGVAVLPLSKKKAKKTKSGPAPAPPPQVDVIEIDNESEDDNQHRQTGKRGPKTDTRQHFFPPVATSNDGKKRWAFKCRHCKTCLTVSRTVAKTDLFEDEPRGPPLGNLATHMKQHDGVPLPEDVQSGETRTPSASSAKIMAEFLREGKLNPVINSTQANFPKIFAAWIIEDDLAFTTGETDGIRRLFAFMQSRYILPSDTSVRNALSKIYLDIYHLVKSELAASVSISYVYNI